MCSLNLSLYLTFINTFPLRDAHVLVFLLASVVNHPFVR